MTSANDRPQCVAVNFTLDYYTMLVEKPESLSAFYTDGASFDHLGCKAQGSADIRDAVKTLYAPRPDAEVNIGSIVAEMTGDHKIFATIKGTIPSAAPAAAVSFTHDVELMEYAAHPGSFGVVSDRREETALREEAPTRWALETPPMFAQEPAAEAMEPIEQPPAATAEAPAAAEPAAPAEEPPAAEPPAEEPPAAEAPAPAQPKRPLSFVEALKKTPKSGAGASAPVTVVAKEAREAPQPPAQTRERREAPQAERDAKGTHKPNAQATARKAAPAEGEKRGAANERTANANANGTKPRKDAEGRALSRSVVFYDIIAKGLPTGASKQYVQDLVHPTAPVKEVKIVSQSDKKDATVTRTFAFIQLDHEAIKESGEDVKERVAQVIELNKTRKPTNGQRIQMDEVREKYTAAPATATTEATTA